MANATATPDSASLPDFVKLAEAYGAVGLRASHPSELDGLIEEMIDTPLPVILDCRVERSENCFPMIRARRTTRCCWPKTLAKSAR